MSIFIIGILYAIAFVMFLICPLLVKIIVFVINMFTSDPIPYIDEICMIGGILRNMAHLDSILDFYEDHPWAKYVTIGLAIFLLFIVLKMIIF